MSKHYFLFLVTLLLLAYSYCPTGLAQNAETNCPSNIFKIISDKTTGKEFSVMATEGNESFVLGKEKNKEALYLGISPQGHYYLLVGKNRIDGDILTSKAQVTELGANSNGYLIRFPSISKEVVSEISDIFSKAPNNQFTNYAFTCVQTSCSLLSHHFDIKIAGKSWGPEVHPSLTLQKILKNGFVNSKNEQLPIEIIKTSRRVPALNEFTAALKIKDRMINTSVVFMILGTGGGLAYIQEKSKN